MKEEEQNNNLSEALKKEQEEEKQKLENHINEQVAKAEADKKAQEKN